MQYMQYMRRQNRQYIKWQYRQYMNRQYRQYVGLCAVQKAPKSTLHAPKHGCCCKQYRQYKCRYKHRQYRMPHAVPATTCILQLQQAVPRRSSPPTCLRGSSSPPHRPQPRPAPQQHAQTALQAKHAKPHKTHNINWLSAPARRCSCSTALRVDAVQNTCARFHPCRTQLVQAKCCDAARAVTGMLHLPHQC
jgi:hypothetical protein